MSSAAAVAHTLLLSCSYLLVLSTVAKGAALCGHVEESDSLIVETVYGKVKGMDNGEARVFKGVRYGGDVSAPNRWRDAPLPDSWTGIMDATKNPPACPQNCNPDNFLLCPGHGIERKEDCLFLNVYTPRDADASSQLSVLVFFHGGAFDTGYSATPLYESSYLANHSNIVVVTVNYRLGALGFFVYGSGEDAITGNYGIKDQRLALEWVQDNIAAFGGNPGDVTISGQSAGAMSVAIHMTSPKSAGLFHKASLESEPFGLNYKESEPRHDLSAALLRDMGCLTLFESVALRCLREEANVSDILREQRSTSLENTLGLLFAEDVVAELITWTPVIDGDELTDQPLALFQAGQFTEVPTIMGTTSGEAITYIYGIFDKVSPLCYKNFAVPRLFGAENRDEILAQYPPSRGLFADQRWILSQLVTDDVFYCPTIWSAESVANSGNVPVYSFVFSHAIATAGFEGYEEPCSMEACHGSHLPFVFHTYEDLMTEDDLKLADRASAYWGNFVRSGDPNIPLSPTEPALDEWPQFTATEQTTLFLDTTPNLETVNAFRKEYCDVVKEVVSQPSRLISIQQQIQSPGISC